MVGIDLNFPKLIASVFFTFQLNEVLRETPYFNEYSWDLQRTPASRLYLLLIQSPPDDVRFHSMPTPNSTYVHTSITWDSI